MFLGIDVSTYLEELEHDAKFYSDGVMIDPLDAFANNGVNYMRIRVWNDPYGENGEPYLAGNCDMNNYVKLAKLAKSKGYRILMDFHYSDFWADPSKQMLPKAWRNYNIDELCNAVYEFTKECLEISMREDVAPEMIQVGNEITHGILWPLGQLQFGDKRGNYDNFIRLVKSGCKACREVIPEAKIALHLERSYDKEVYREFYTKMQEADVDYDIIGASYYPYWHGTPEQLFENLRDCRVYGKEIVIMELGYGFSTEPYKLNGEDRRVIFDSEEACPPEVAEKYHLTKEGQAAFIRDFLKTAREEGICGIFYWEPLWIPGEGICWASPEAQKYVHEEGKPTLNEWANQCLFDYLGNKLPAFDEFK